MNLKKVWFIALNNLRLFVTDRLAMGMFILFPFLFIIMFNILLSNVGTQDARLELHVATQESSGLSRQIISSMVTTDTSKLAPGDPDIIWEKDYAQAVADVESSKLHGLLVFPSDFTQNLQNDQNTRLEVIAEADSTTTQPALNGLAQAIISRLEARKVEIDAVAALMAQQGSNQADIQRAITQIMQAPISGDNTQSTITYQAENIGDVKPVSASSYVVPGYLVMFVFFAAGILAVEIIRERQNHTLERLLATSVSKETILGGFYIGAFLRGLMQIIIFWTFGILVFHVDMGVAPWAVILLSILTVMMSAGFSLLLATLVKTERSASALAVLCSLFLAALGGSWWPLFIDPKWMQFLAKLTPHGWANEGFNKLMLFGAEGGDVIWQMLALLGFGLAFIVIALINFRTSAETT